MEELCQLQQKGKEIALSRKLHAQVNRSTTLQTLDESNNKRTISPANHCGLRS